MRRYIITYKHNITSPFVGYELVHGSKLSDIVCLTLPDPHSKGILMFKIDLKSWEGARGVQDVVTHFEKFGRAPRRA